MFFINSQVISRIITCVAGVAVDVAGALLAVPKGGTVEGSPVVVPLKPPGFLNKFANVFGSDGACVQNQENNESQLSYFLQIIQTCRWI